jgi:hypothetical protein
MENTKRRWSVGFYCPWKFDPTCNFPTLWEAAPPAYPARRRITPLSVYIAGSIYGNSFLIGFFGDSLASIDSIMSSIASSFSRKYSPVDSGPETDGK